MRYLLDSDTVNYILKNVSPVADRYEAAVLAGAEFVLSSVVHYEVTRYLLLKNATRRHRFYMGLVSEWQSADLENEDWQKAAELWAARHRMGKPIQDSDLLIAVSALKTKAILVINSISHFADLELAIENWTLTEKPSP